MRILFIANKYTCGRKEYGLSYEHSNFFDCLWHMGHDIMYFDHVVLARKLGRARMNRRLAEVVGFEKPDLMLSVLTEDELDRNTVRSISDQGHAATCNWFCDDHYRFDDYSRHWAPCFHKAVTTAHSALDKYRAAGLTNVIASQWACNPFSYRKLNLPLKYDVTFVGTLHSNRRYVLQSLRAAGLNVRCWGINSPRGALTTQRMIEVFNQSRINLNFSGASATAFSGSGHTATRHWAINAAKELINATPAVGRWARRVRAVQRGRRASSEKVREALCVQHIPQIKGRNFELPGCGGFQLSGRAENIEDYFTNRREVCLFDDVPDLASKVRYYLDNEDERWRIAQAGYDRCRREHTYVHRFNQVFESLGLPSRDIDVESPPSVGTVEIVD